MSDKHRHLAWFLGPKGENADVLEDLLLLILRDYLHWRKNYFPGDEILISKVLQRRLLDEHDGLHQHVHELLADLRRNFPFYSPRYIAHQLSDTTMASMLGYVAGMLFNPNNVTPEAAPVTAQLEIEACNEILKMLGFNAPPPPPDGNEDLLRYYEQHATREFGWAHLTSGGTVANIEAIWVARQVRYFPLAVKRVAIERQLDIEIKLPNDTVRKIVDVADMDLLVLKPNEQIYLLSKYVDAFKKNQQLYAIPPQVLGRLAWNALDEQEYSLSAGTGKLFNDYPPVVFVAGTGHYSIQKAANVIGIGAANVVKIPTDSQFRLNVQALEQAVNRAIASNKVPLCVVATAGTTEEGAVDPVHDIVALREKFERNRNLSFWVHIDAAWGGYIRTLFRTEPLTHVRAIMTKVARVLKMELPADADVSRWHQTFSSEIQRMFVSGASSDLDQEQRRDSTEVSHAPENEIDEVEGVPVLGRFERRLLHHLSVMETLLSSGEYARYARLLESFPRQLKTDGMLPIPVDAFQLSADDRHTNLTEFVSGSFQLQVGRYYRQTDVSWPSRDVFNSFDHFGSADSITVDPHKMGYLPYPCGCVAFRNDRVRHFVTQRAPYITGSKPNVLLHLPPMHRNLSGNNAVEVDAFGPFILEGSKPGAAATALWLSTRAIPLTREHHGLIVRASLLAARELHEWLVRWNWIHQKIEADIDYQFISLTERTPDSNLVTFVVKKRTSTSLSEMNTLTELVYNHFSIQAEMGDMQFSYSQSFFLSRTVMHPDEYPTSDLEPFFVRAGLANRARVEYPEKGIVVLRAAVMNPYIDPLRNLVGQDLAREFVEELARVSERHVREI